MNLYGFVGNDGVGSWDRLGLQGSCTEGECCIEGECRVCPEESEYGDLGYGYYSTTSILGGQAPLVLMPLITPDGITLVPLPGEGGKNRYKPKPGGPLRKFMGRAGILYLVNFWWNFPEFQDCIKDAENEFSQCLLDCNLKHPPFPPHAAAGYDDCASKCELKFIYRIINCVKRQAL
jgi:hypothetical protein